MRKSICRWFYAVKLNLIDLEIQDVLDDMSEALHTQNFGVYRALADFHTDLVTEALQLRAKLNSLNH